MKNPLRIAVLLGSFPVLSETFIVRQITALLNSGQEVHIYADRPGDDALRHADIEKHRLLDRTTFVEGPEESIRWEMPVVPLQGETWCPGAVRPTRNIARIIRAAPVFFRCLRRSVGLTRQLLSERHYGWRARSLSGLYRMASLLADHPTYDVLHAHFGPTGNAFRFARELFNAPLVISFHGYDFCTVPRKEGRNVYHGLFKVADVITANSRYTQGRLEELDCPPRKIRVLPVGLDLEEFPYHARTFHTGETFRVLTVGRLVKIKGHQFAIRAMARLRSTHRNFQYDIVGAGPMQAELEGLIRELGVGDVVKLHGARTGTELQQFYANAHVFVLASSSTDGDQEGQGLVLQEALACGLPIVATRHGAFPESVGEHNARWLVREADPEDLVLKIRELIATHADWPSMGLNNRAFVAGRYSMQTLNQQLLAIYQTASSAFLAR